MLIELILAAGVMAASPGGDVIALKNSDVLVVDSIDRPLFRSSREYLLRLAKNPAGHVVRYDRVARRVLISSAGPQYWVHCAELSPMAASCPAVSPRPATRSMRVPRSGAPATGIALRGLPACPGDPRCPKSD